MVCALFPCISIISGTQDSVFSSLSRKRAGVLNFFSIQSESECRILNFQQFFLNLTQANEEGRAEWQLEYDFLDYYGQLTTSLQTFATGFQNNTLFHHRFEGHDSKQCCQLGGIDGAGRASHGEILAGVNDDQDIHLLYALFFLKSNLVGITFLQF